MRREEALAELKRLREYASGDQEDAHMAADEVLLKLIDDGEVRRAFEDIPRWYS